MTKLMFDFSTASVNPILGECTYHCIYCWARIYEQRYNMDKYCGMSRLDRSVFRRKFGKGDFVFTVSMVDPLSPDVPVEWIRQIFSWILKNPEANFFFLTKNPVRYLELVKGPNITLDSPFPTNLILGATIESNLDAGLDNYRRIGNSIEYNVLSKAPPPSARLRAMQELRGLTKNRLFISVEPILDFEITTFIETIKDVDPWAVAVGYDNYGFSLPEPEIEKTNELIEWLSEFTDIYVKTIRNSWWNNSFRGLKI